MFRLGWQVLRAQIGETVDPVRVRRAVWVSVVVAVVVLVGLVALQTAFEWTAPGAVRPVVVITLLTVASFSVSFACFPTAVAIDPPATINGRRVRPDAAIAARHSVQPYLRFRPPPVAPGDRDAVLNDVPLMQRAVIRLLARLGPLVIGLAVAGIALLVAGAPPLPLVWTVVYLLLAPDWIVRLGRAERARRAALAVPPPPDTDPADSPPARRRDPLGSKVRLPGD